MPANRISFPVTTAQKTAVITATGELEGSIAPLKIVISKQELKPLSKLGDVRIPFVEKVVQYADSNPEFLQPFADVGEFKQDFATFEELRELIRPIRRIIDNLETSMMVSGSEAYDFARMYYKAVTFAAKMGVPDAQTIADDLRTLFEAKTTPPATPTP